MKYTKHPNESIRYCETSLVAMPQFLAKTGRWFVYGEQGMLLGAWMPLPENRPGAAHQTTEARTFHQPIRTVPHSLGCSYAQAAPRPSAPATRLAKGSVLPKDD